MTVDVPQLERELTAYIGDILRRTPDRDIYRGGFPVGTVCGVAVIVDGRIVSNEYLPPSFKVQVLGKFSDRDQAWQALSALSEHFPRWGVQAGGFVCTEMLAQGDPIGPYCSPDDGKATQRISFNLVVSVLTKNPS